MMQSDRRRFQARLEESPDDWDLRRVYADWLEEQGEDALAAGQRWQAQHRKRPHRLTATGGHPFCWTCVGGLPECGGCAWLPRDVCQEMGFREWRCYRTQGEAEDALALGLGRLREDE